VRRNAAAVLSRPVRAPVQSETTTAAAYCRPPAATTTTRPLRYRAIADKPSASPMETQSVHRTSYRPPPPSHAYVGTKAKAPYDSRRSAAPVESRTVYTTFYGRGDGTTSDRRSRRGTTDGPPRAHDYDVWTRLNTIFIFAIMLSCGRRPSGHIPGLLRVEESVK